LIPALSLLVTMDACEAQDAVQVPSRIAVADPSVVTGAERTAQYLPLLKDKRVAVVTNQTGMIGHTHLVDSLLALKVNVVKVFAPEHGFRGDADAGEHVRDDKDKRTGVKVVSLYGDNKKPSAAQLARAARLGVIAVPQSIFLLELGRNFRDYLPDVLMPRCYPLRAMLDAGVTVALSSDAPVVENDNPLAGMTAAILRQDRRGEALLPEQAITAAEALDAYTRGSATSVGLEDALGTLKRGAWADIAVLSGNPLTTAPEALPSLSVEMTLLAGQVVYER
jgi:hypothetical protein